MHNSGNVKPLAIIELTNAESNVKAKLYARSIVGMYYSETIGYTVLYTTGGPFPIKESPEEIDQLIQKEALDGRQV